MNVGKGGTLKIKIQKHKTKAQYKFTRTAQVLMRMTVPGHYVCDNEGEKARKLEVKEKNEYFISLTR